MNADHAKDRETLCLRGGHVLTFNDDDSVFEEGEVWIENGVITAVGPVGAAPPPSGAAPARHIDAKGRIVMPGLINGHAHSYGALLKGTVDVKPLDIFMLHVIAANVDRSAREVTVSALVDCISMFRTGTTAVIDHFSHRPATTSEALGAVMAAYGEAGMRAMVAPMFSDLPYLETVPLDAAALPAEVREAYAKQGRPALAPYFQVIEEGLGMATQYDGLVNVLLGVDGPQRCSPELLEMTADFQGRHGIGLHSHMLEAKTQAVMAGEVGFVRRFLELGVINDKSSFAHFIWCSDDDIAAAREAGVTIIHVPGSNLMVGSGICPVLKLRRAGLAVAVGTDGANCSAPNMFEKLRLACLLARVTEPEFEDWLGARDTLKMGLSGGARAFGQSGGATSGDIGVLAPGARADVVVLDPGSYLHRPLGDVWNHLVYYESGAGAETVVVDGRVVMEEGRLLTIDEEAVLAEAEEIVTRQRQGAATTGPGIAAQYPAFHDMIVGTLETAGGPARYAKLD